MKAIMLKGRFVGGMRDLRKKFAKSIKPRMMNAHVRIAHPNPTSSIMRLTMMGNRTPPRLDPLAASPIAMPRFLKNHVDTQDTAGVKMQAAPMAEQTPWDRRNW